jgi:hypothetical protein
MISLPCELMVSGATPNFFMGDDVRIGALFRGTLVEEIAVGAPRLQGSLHRRRGDGLFEETQRSLIGLQLPRHEGSRIGRRWPRLLREQGFAKPGEQRGRSWIDVGAARLPQRGLRKPAAKDADGRDAGLSRG